MAKITSIGSQVRMSEAIDDFNLDIGFVEAVINVLFTIDGHNMLDELHSGTVCSLLAEAHDRLERTEGYTNSLCYRLEKAEQVKIA